MVQPVLWKLNLKANGISGGFNLLLMGKNKKLLFSGQVLFSSGFSIVWPTPAVLGLWAVWSTCSVSLLLFQVTTLITCFVYLVCLSSRFVLVSLYSPWSACFLRGFMFAVSLMVQLLWRIIMKDNKRRLWLLHVYRRGGPGFRGCFVHQVEKFLSRIVYVPVCDCT